MHIEHIHPTRINQIWHLVADWLSSGSEFYDDNFELPQLRMALVSADQHLLVFMDGETPIGAATAAMTNYPNDRVAFITALGGKGVFNKEGVACVDAWAKSMGGTCVRAYVRESVARLSEQVGLERKCALVEFKL
jgi:hypothetical protein